MKTQQIVGRKMICDDVWYNTFGKNNTEIISNEESKINSFSTVAKFSKPCPSVELQNVKAYNKTGQNIKPEEIRYIILGNKNTETEFREMKELCRNVLWIQVEEVSFYGGARTVILTLSARILTKQNVRNMTT
jgi:hypothetical protein